MDEVSRIIGQTPLVKLAALSSEIGVSVFAKYEASNPGASLKDRAVRAMLDHAEEAGQIVPGKSVLVEPTSGNTGIALAMIGAVRGYHVVLCMPESMSKERRILLAAYGAELVLTPAAEGMAGAVACAQTIVSERKAAWMMGQFENPFNPWAHEHTTAPEIHEALGSCPDYFIAGVGTGGTLSGVAHYFKKQGAATQFFAVEPAESPLISQSLQGAELHPASHGIQGIGANFIPEVLDKEVLNGALAVTTVEALQAARGLAKTEGLLVGISSGANIAAVKKLVEHYPQSQSTTIVTVLVDTGERYLSTALFE